MTKPDPDTALRRKRFAAYCVAKGWGTEGQRWQVTTIAQASGKSVSKISNLLNGTGSFGSAIARELEAAFQLPKFYLDGGGWPFEEIDFARWEGLTERQKGRVEGTMKREIEQIERERFGNGSAAAA